jgi:RNA polymerase sigma factor (sigma-70 family)
LNGTTSADEAARKRVAVEMIAKHGRTLRRTARRYSICADDAEDALQRALEILMLKAPPGEARDLVRWMQTVTKHEALAIRRSRERQLGAPRPGAEGPEETVDWISLIPASSEGPEEQAEQREEMARSREALKTLKPAELRALTLLAEGYSYAEIGELTGYSRTKVNRCLAEGRERFRAFLSRSESGGRCAELRPILSAFCDGEADPAEVPTLREHLRACAHCRAAMRAYRTAPGAAALAPLPFARSLLDRAHQALAGLQARLHGPRAATESAIGQVAASGGARGAGLAGLTKALAVCAATAGGAAACVGAGVVPAPLGIVGDAPASRPAASRDAAAAPASGPAPTSAPLPDPSPARPPAPADNHHDPEPPPAPEEQEAVPTEAGAIEYAPEAPAPAPAPVATPSAAESRAGEAAGEFGP